MRNQIRLGSRAVGEVIPLPRCLSYCHFGIKIFFMAQRDLERLKAVAARNNKLIKKEVELDGEDFTFWHRPLKITEYQEAKAGSKNPEDALETAVRLFVKKALDENGQQQYQVDAVPILQRMLPMEMATKLIGALQTSEEEDIELDMKSTEEPVKKGSSASK